MSDGARIAVIGSFNTDLMVRAPRLPVPGETVLGTTFHMGAGGKGANQAVAAARLGAAVEMVACLGDDEFGRLALTTLSGEGVDVDHVTLLEGVATGVALIMVDDVHGENMIVVAPGANERVSAEHVNVARDVLASSDVLLMQLEIPLETVEHAARVGRECGARVILNPAPGRPLSRELLAMVDVLTPNETEARIIAGLDGPDWPGAKDKPDESGVASAAEAAKAAKVTMAAEAAEALLAQGCNAAVITLGSSGVLVADAAGCRRIPPYMVDAVDTTGAGDAFSGALAVALAEGMSLDDACRFANAAAAISVTRVGTAAAMPTRSEVDKFIAQRWTVDRAGAERLKCGCCEVFPGD